MSLRIVILVLAFAWSATTSAQVDSCHYNPDVDHDGLVTVVDLMGLLSFFGSADPDLDCWFGPEDDCFGVVDACGVCGGDGVDADADGVCDDVDDCVGAVDVCGICNGPGPVVQVVDSVIVTMDSVYFEEMDFWFVYQTDVDTLFSLTCPTLGCTDPAAWNFDPSANWEDGSCLDGPLQCGEVTSVNYHGHEYPVVAIGDQCWFAENLRTLNFRNGDPIHLSDSTESWPSMGKPAAVAYNYDDEIAAERGYLYTGFVAIDQREACPAGWRIPLDADFAELESYLGMPEESLFAGDWRGSDEAFALKATLEDVVPWNGTNTSGFSAVPMGDIYDSFQGGDYGVTFWARDGLGWNSDNYYRALASGGQIFRATHNIFAGHALRCMRTMETEVCWDPDGDGICPGEEIGGCLDPGAWNYNPEATANSFNCTYGPPECGDVSSIQYQGHDYELVAIGDQCWFAENLQAEHYLNGDSIPTGISDEDWFGLGYGGQLTLDHDPANVATYGRLYNWHAVQDSRGLCPVGWRVPSDEAWTAMELTLGLDSVYADSMGWRGTNHGNQLKMPSEEYPAWGGSNSSGFGALPGARVASGGGFGLYGYGLWWTATEYQPGEAWSRIMFNADNVNRDFGSKGSGLSIRCVRVADESCWDPDGDGICAEDEISGCTDSLAWNFDQMATEDAGNCLLNEPGTACDDGEAETFNDVWQSDGATCSGIPFVDPAGNGPCMGELAVDYQGFAYGLVEIAGNCWFRKNLQSTHFLNGELIPTVLSTSDWLNGPGPSVNVYGDTGFAYDGSTDTTQNLFDYGRLYTWDAAVSEFGVCPAGYGVPTDEDWQSLANSFGGVGSAGRAIKSTGTLEDSTGLWLASTAALAGTNASGFSGEPGGWRGYNNWAYAVQGSRARWWGITDTIGAYNVELFSYSDQMALGPLPYVPTLMSYSVRCIKLEDGTCFDPDGDGICPEDELTGCTDASAWNFNPEATANDFTCTYGPPECGDVSTIHYQGHDYELVAIGDQCWFAENLNASNFTNGDAIPQPTEPGDWTTVTSSMHDEVTEESGYGKHYNGWAVWDSRGLCPSDFRVGTDQDWQTLEAALGMDEAELSNTWLRGTDEGYQMKAAPSDAIGWDGTNSSGISILPTGKRQDGNAPQVGVDALIWSPNSNQVNNAGFNSPSMWLWYRQWFSDEGQIVRFTATANLGFGVRCVRAEGACFDPDGDGVCAEDEISGCMDASSANFNPAATEDDGTCTASACGDLESVNFDGYDYDVVGVGSQCWFAENLRSWHYANGDLISVPESGEEWMSAEEGAVGTYADGTVNCAHFCWPDSAAALFGNVYSGYAVTDERNVCPSGWHAPSNDEWVQLEEFTAAYVGDSVSFALRADFLWDNPVAGSDVWGMGLLPAGVRDIWTGGPEEMLDANAATQGQFWTTTIHPGDEELGWHRYYHHNTPEPSVGVPSRKEGKSVRCLKD